MSPSTFTSRGWQLALKIASYIPGVVDSVEQTIQAPGPEKQAKAVAMIEKILEATEGIAGKDLVKNEDVRDASKAIIDAYVHLANIVEEVRRKDQGGEPAPSA